MIRSSGYSFRGMLEPHLEQGKDVVVGEPIKDRLAFSAKSDEASRSQHGQLMAHGGLA
jgi:hypothetical protein